LTVETGRMSKSDAIMKQKHSVNFLIGLTIGGLLALLFWYWQKSTSAEDGALKLLDRLAETEKRVRLLKTEIASGHPPAPTQASSPPVQTAPAAAAAAEHAAAPEAEDLTGIKGIGPVFQQRLHENGVRTIAAVRLLTAARLAEILQIAESRAERILTAA
jgi:predicted flap endonuclease-1-like 5' DNA nuclease